FARGGLRLLHEARGRRRRSAGGRSRAARRRRCRRPRDGHGLRLSRRDGGRAPLRPRARVARADQGEQRARPARRRQGARGSVAGRKDGAGCRRPLAGGEPNSLGGPLRVPRSVRGLGSGTRSGRLLPGWQAAVSRAHGRSSGRGGGEGHPPNPEPPRRSASHQGRRVRGARRAGARERRRAEGRVGGGTDGKLGRRCRRRRVPARERGGGCPAPHRLAEAPEASGTARLRRLRSRLRAVSGGPSFPVLRAGVGSATSREALDFDLPEPHRLLRDTVREFAAREIAPRAREWDREERFPHEIVPRLAELGLLGVRIPEAFGAAGLAMRAYALCAEESARVDGSLALTVASHKGLGTGHVLAVGTEAQKQKYLPRAAKGEWLAAWALTEPGS